MSQKLVCTAAGGFASLLFDQGIPKNSQGHLADCNSICILHRSDCAWLCCLLSQLLHSTSYSHQSQFAHIIFKDTMEDLPTEIVLQILGYLSLGELIQCARVSKRLKNICKDRSLRYKSSMSVIKILTVKDRKSIIDILIARPEVTEVTMKNPSNSLETKNFVLTLLNFCDTASFLYFWI